MGETLQHIFRPGNDGFEKDWERLRVKNIKAARQRGVDAFAFTVFALASFLAFVAILSVFVNAPSEQVLAPLKWIVATILVFLAVFPLFEAGKTVRSYYQDRALGFSADFKHEMSWRVVDALASSENALYACRSHRERSGVLEVARIPFNQIDACAWSDCRGVPVVHLYDGKGGFFSVSSPIGKGVANADDLVQLIRALKG